MDCVEYLLPAVQYFSEIMLDKCLAGYLMIGAALIAIVLMYKLVRWLIRYISRVRGDMRSKFGQENQPPTDDDGNRSPWSFLKEILHDDKEFDKIEKQFIEIDKILKKRHASVIDDAALSQIYSARPNPYNARQNNYPSTHEDDFSYDPYMDNEYRYMEEALRRRQLNIPGGQNTTNQ